MDLTTLLQNLKDLPLKECLALLLAEGVKDLGKKGYESIRDLIRNKVAEKKYGFIPRKEEGNVLLRVQGRQYFQEFNRILPRHRHADIIRSGYLISHLNKTGGTSSKGRIKEIKENIHGRPNGAILIKIINLVTTGAIVPVLDYLDELKKKKYPEEYILDEFEDILRDWNRVTYFVKSEDAITEVYEEIKRRLERNQRLIMVFSYGSKATLNTTQAVAKARVEALDADYYYESKNNKEGDSVVHSSSFMLLD